MNHRVNIRYFMVFSVFGYASEDPVGPARQERGVRWWWREGYVVTASVGRGVPHRRVSALARTWRNFPSLVRPF